MNEFTIDFGLVESELLTGRKNGSRARDFFKLQSADKYILKSRVNQLITSSYFLGLMEDELKSFGTPANALKNVDMTQLSPESKDECEKAIKRGLAKNKGLI